MPTLTVEVTDRLTGAVLGLAMKERIEKFKDAEQKSLKLGAAAATAETRKSFKYHRDIIPKRAGRSSTGGQMLKYMRWGVPSNSHEVAFTKTAADKAAPHWIIQEIGTGESATISQGEHLPAITVSIPKQRGRRISPGLVFATGGKWSAPGASNHEQLFRAESITGVPLGVRPGTGPQRRSPGLRIKREIHGQHFVQKGGRAGFRQYETSLLAAARQAFGKRTP